MENKNWTMEMTMQFIEGLRSRRLLWDPKHDDYKHRFKKSKAWDSLAASMKIKRKEAETKCHNLRSQFRRELRKDILAERSGTVRQNKWFAYEALKFLIDEDEMAKARSQQRGDSDTDTTMPEEVNIKREVFLYEEEEEQDYATSEPEPEQNLIQQTPQSDTNRSLKRKMITDGDHEDDEFSTYGKYVASELRSLRDEHSMIMAKHFISTILTKARLGKYRQKENNADSDNDF